MAETEPKSNCRIEQIFSVNVVLKQQINALLDEDVEWDNTQGQRFLGNPDNVLFLAFVEDKPVAFLTAYRLQRFDIRKAEVLLYEIGVLDEFQRQGIATALIAALKKWAVQAEADEVWVLTYASNKAAMGLYKSTRGEEARRY